MIGLLGPIDLRSLFDNFIETFNGPWGLLDALIEYLQNVELQDVELLQDVVELLQDVELLQYLELIQDAELLQDVEHPQDVELLQGLEHIQDNYCIFQSYLAFLNACSARFKVGLDLRILKVLLM